MAKDRKEDNTSTELVETIKKGYAVTGINDVMRTATVNVVGYEVGEVVSIPFKDSTVQIEVDTEREYQVNF